MRLSNPLGSVIPGILALAFSVLPAQAQGIAPVTPYGGAMRGVLPFVPPGWGGPIAQFLASANPDVGVLVKSLPLGMPTGAMPQYMNEPSIVGDPKIESFLHVADNPSPQQMAAVGIKMEAVRNLLDKYLPDDQKQSLQRASQDLWINSDPAERKHLQKTMQAMAKALGGGVPLEFTGGPAAVDATTTERLKRPSSWVSLSPATFRANHGPSLSAIDNLTPPLAAPTLPLPVVPIARLKAALSFDSIFQNDPNVRRLEAVRAETKASDLDDDAKARIYADIDDKLHAIRADALNPQRSAEKPQRGRLLRWINAATAGIVDRYESWQASRAAAAATKTAIAEGKMIQFNGQTFPVVSFPKKGDESLLEKLISAANVSIDFSDGDAISPEIRKALDQAEARGVVVRFNRHLSARDHNQFAILDGKITEMDQGQMYWLTPDPEWLSYWTSLYRPTQ